MFGLFKKRPPDNQRELPLGHPYLISTLQSAVQGMTMAELKAEQLLIAHRVVTQPYATNVFRLAIIQAQICILENNEKGRV